MILIPFGKLMNRVLEKNKKGAVFNIKRSFIADPGKTYKIFGRRLETLPGPAAGLHTQLAQNIAASYVASGHSSEPKTVQKLDGGDPPVSKPCIKADDECYNCEQSIELCVPQALNEYVKAWFICKVLAREYGLGSPNGFQFNMSVGYDLDGIKTGKIDRFIEGMKDASEATVLKECRQRLLDNLDRSEKVPREDVEAISPNVCNCTTLSTLYGCPPQEIERIVRYLVEERKVHTFIKCGLTLLGCEYARKIMDGVEYDYVTFSNFHFEGDLQYRDVVPMLQRLQALADEKGLEFDVKITNTFPVGVRQDKLPSEEMHMSGKSLYPLSMSVAKVLAESFGGKLRISYLGGADFFNIADTMDAGIWSVTMTTTMLKPGGYERLEQIGQLFTAREAAAFEGTNATKAAGLMGAVKSDRHHVKAVKPLPFREINKPVPLTGCLIVPCQKGCPIHQDIIRYLQLTGAGESEQTLEATLSKNPPPFIVGTICAHNYMSKCTGNFYESPVDIRRTKLKVAEGGFRAVMVKLKAPEITSDKEAAVVGGSLAGLAAAYFLARGGVRVTLFEKGKKMGGVVHSVIPGFHAGDSAIDNDVKLVTTMSVEMVNSRETTNIEEPKKDYDYVVLTVGVSRQGTLELETGDTMNVLDFLARFKATDGKVELGRDVVAIGGDNTATDTTGAAKRNVGVEKVSLVYRRTRCHTPAGGEELTMTVEDGVEFAELLAPAKLENGVLYCKRMVLGDIGTSGRHDVVETDQVVEAPVDTIIAAVGEKVPGAFHENYGIVLGSKRRPQMSQETLEASVKDVHIVGDGLYGPATVMGGIRDDKMTAEAIVERTLVEDLLKPSDVEAIYERKDRLAEESAHVIDSTRCLSCSNYCRNCIEIRPNRANIFLMVPGMEKRQIIYVDYMCNECGNCKSFRPWDSVPYLGKFTLSANEADTADGKDQGFTVLGTAASVYRVRLQGRATDYTVGSANAGVPDGIQKIIQTVINDYSYTL